MTSAKAILFLLLAAVAGPFVAVWIGDVVRKKQRRRPSGFQLAVGLVTNFFDTLGIGSYATTTSLFRIGRAVDDEAIPGTLNVGHALPTVTQALIYIAIVEVEMRTLVLLIAASVLGAWLGAGVVTRLPRRRIQIGMGLALLGAAALMLGKSLAMLPEGGVEIRLLDGRLVTAIFGCFWFGALMTIGIGAYAPIMIMVSLLGMNPKAAFPIMMGSCAFLMPAASVRFIRRDKYDPRAALGLAAGGIPGVLLAAFLVTEMPLEVVRWLVVVVVLCAAASMLWAARHEARIASPHGPNAGSPEEMSN